MIRPVLFLKATILGGAAGDLFAQPVQVDGYTRGGTYVAPHTAIRHKSPEPPPPAPAPAIAADLAGGRATYPDGRMIPQPGDKVRRGVPGIFGMPIMLEGVVRGRTVQITSGATNRKTDALSPAWTVIGDPALERIAEERRAQRAAEEAAAKAKRDAELAAEEAERRRLVAERGTLDGQTFTPGELLEDPQGRVWVVARVHGGEPYGHPLDGDDTHAGGLGRLDGWRRSSASVPPGTIINSQYGVADRRTAAGTWEPVVWSQRRDAWVTPAEFGPLPDDNEVKRIALAAMDFIDADRRGKGRNYPGYSRVAGMDAYLESQGRELRAVDEGRVLEQMGVIWDMMTNGRESDVFAMRRELAALPLVTEPEAPRPPPPAPAPAPPAALIIPQAQPAAPAEGELLAAERAKLAQYERPGAYVREDILDLSRRRVSADPAKWRVGMGVTYKVAGGKGMQTNRGYRVVGIDPSNKMLRIRLIRDAGYADAMPGQSPDRWIWMGEAQRAKADDAAELGPAPPHKPTGAVIHRAYTADYTSQIDYAKDGQERVWKRTQFRDPRYGYKWTPWKLTKGDIPERATPTDQRARLPA